MLAGRCARQQEAWKAIRTPGQPGLPRRAAEHLTGARRRGVEVGDQPQQGALAAAARPDQRDELTSAYVQVDVLQRDDIGAAAAGEDATDAGDVDRKLLDVP